MARHLLTDRQVQNAKPKEKPYRLADGDGLYLYVPLSGASSWQFRYRLGDKPQTATLGRLDRITLGQARAKAQDVRGLVADGHHVTVVRRVERAKRAAARTATFGVLSADWLKREARRAKWTADYRQEVKASLDNHLSALATLPVAEITTAIAAKPIRKVEDSAPDMATKVRQRLRSIMDYAAEQGLIPINPIPAARRGKRSAQRTHLAAVTDHAGVGAILRAADVAEISRGVRRAHLLAVFTAQRIGEIVGARWDEFDLQAGAWSIPRERMKRKDAQRGPHVVPLPPQLLALLREWRRADGDGAIYAAPAPHGDGPITREAIEKFYRRTLELVGKHSPHSWRSVFSTWGRDAGKDADAVEAQLDHMIGTKQAAAYDRAKRLEIRRELMAWYERQLLTARDGAKVVPLRKATPSS
jgi:integrase